MPYEELMTAFDRWQDEVKKTYITEEVNDEDTWSTGLDFWSTRDDEE